MRDARKARYAALLVAVTLLVASAACNDSDAERAEPGRPSPSPPTNCPLTGEKPPGDVDPLRPAVAVKVENAPQARPQHGLGQADVVFEEIVEGGITRFAAIFHCGSSEKVGPARSARFDDADIVKPFTRVLAHSGANAIVDKKLDRENIIVFTEQQSDAFFRDPPGSTDVHSLYLNVEEVRSEVDGRDGVTPDADIFEFGEVNAGAERARKVSANFTDSITIEYRWRDGAWRRFEDGDRFRVRPGGQVAVPNVLVQQVVVNRSERLVDSTGNPSPEIKLGGSGRAWLFRDGRVVAGEWEAGGGATSFVTDDGESFRFATGAIWVELVPHPKRGDVNGKISFQ